MQLLSATRPLSAVDVRISTNRSYALWGFEYFLGGSHLTADDPPTDTGGNDIHGIGLNNEQQVFSNVVVDMEVRLQVFTKPSR